MKWMDGWMGGGGACIYVHTDGALKPLKGHIPTLLLQRASHHFSSFGSWHIQWMGMQSIKNNNKEKEKVKKRKKVQNNLFTLGSKEILLFKI